MKNTDETKAEQVRMRKDRERIDKEIRNESTPAREQMEERSYLEQEGYVTERYSE
jgi:hypothetical protein